MKFSDGLGRIISYLIMIAICSGCAPQIPREALELTPDSLSRRQLQTRRFETEDENKLLKASAAVLQDLGFNLDESETKLGLIAASKTRDATNAGQIAGAILIAALTGAEVAVDKVQNIRASLVTRPSLENKKNMMCRITFQRVIYDSQQQISKTESLEDPVLYQEFFDKLSKSVFLQANEL